MYSKEIQEDTGDIAAHVNHGNVHQMWKKINEPQMGRQTACQRRTAKRGQGCCHTECPRVVEYFMGPDCAAKQNAVQNTPQGWSICTEKLLSISLTVCKHRVLRKGTFPSKSCCSEREGGIHFTAEE